MVVFFKIVSGDYNYLVYIPKAISNSELDLVSSQLLNLQAAVGTLTRTSSLYTDLLAI